MLPVSFIRDNKERVLKSLRVRNNKEEQLIDQILQADDRRKELQQKLESYQSESNSIAGEIKELYKTGRGAEAGAKKERGSELKTMMSAVKEELNTTKDALEGLLLQMPNCANDIVPEGLSDEDNQVKQAWDKELPSMEEEALPHWELAKKYNLIDFEMGAKITGAGFPVYVGKGARLQRALISFFLDEAEAAGYKEYQLPYMVNEASARGTGQLPDKEGQMYHVEKQKFH